MPEKLFALADLTIYLYFYFVHTDLILHAFQ